MFDKFSFWTCHTANATEETFTICFLGGIGSLAFPKANRSLSQFSPYPFNWVTLLASTGKISLFYAFQNYENNYPEV
jgi:hypothetical protein